MRRADPASMRPTLAHYVAAVLVTAAALGLTLLLEPVHHLTPSVFLLAAVIFSSWYGGLLPGLLSAELSALFLNYFLLPPFFAFSTSVDSLVSAAIFLMTSVLVGILHAQRNRALADLRRERDRLQVTMFSIGDAVIATDVEGRITFMNPPAEALTGWPQSEAHGRPLAEVFRIANQATGEPAESPVEKVLREGMIVGLANHTVLIRRDGTRTPIDDSAAPIRDAAGGMLGVILVFRDVTHRRSAEEALRESEERFRLMAETVPDILFIALPGGLVEYVNTRFYEYTGLPEGSGLGLGWEAALHPDDMERNREAWRRAEQAGEPYRSEFQLRSGDGSYRWFVSRARPIRDAEGTITKWYGACTDIDRARRAQRALETVNVRLRDTLESITDAFFAVDSDFRFLEVNPVARNFFRDKPDEELLGRVFWEVFPEAVGSEFYEQYRQALETGQSVHFEGHSRIIDRWFEVHAYPRTGRLEVYLRDITDRIQAHERMALLQELTAGFSRAATREEVAAVVMDTARSLLGSHLCSVMMLTADGENVEIMGQLGAQRDLLEPFRQIPLSHPSALPEAIRTGQPVWVENQEEYIRRFPEVADVIAHHTRSQSTICAPMIVGGAIIGGVGFSFPQARRFDAEDRKLFQAIAEQCAQAIERARLYEAEAQARRDAEEAEQRTALLQELTAALSGALTRSAVGEVIVGRALEALGGHIGGVALLSDDGEDLIVVNQRGLSPELNQTLSHRPVKGPGALPEAARTGEPLWIETEEDYRRRYPDFAPGFVEQTGTRAVASLPLIVNQRIIGSIGINFPHERSFSEADRAFLIAVADQCTQALERARLYEIEAKARQTAEQADQIRVKFLGMVSHELRNPLTSIKGFASTLLAEDVTWDKTTQDEFIRLIDEEADKLSELVEQLLDLSRMETGHFSIQPVPTTPHAIIEAAMPQLSLITSKHQLAIDLPGTLPSVEADTRRIAQVLNNLVGNAAKFSPPGTTIYVEVSARDRGVQFDVTDQGSGIAPEDRVRIFEAFRQGQHQPGEITKGAGLGLAIARGLVEAHQGRIWIQERAGPGTTFSFLLPAHFHSSQK